jgi:hypothetical protein
MTTCCTPASEDSQQDVGAVGDLKIAGVRDDAADVPRGDRIGDDTDDGTGHVSIPGLLTC